MKERSFCGSHTCIGYSQVGGEGWSFSLRSRVDTVFWRKSLSVAGCSAVKPILVLTVFQNRHIQRRYFRISDPNETADSDERENSKTLRHGVFPQRNFRYKPITCQSQHQLCSEWLTEMENEGDCRSLVGDSPNVTTDTNQSHARVSTSSALSG